MSSAGLPWSSHCGDPGRLLAGDALPVKQIDGAIELEQHAAQSVSSSGQIAGRGRRVSGEIRQSWPAKRPRLGNRSRTKRRAGPAG